MYLPAETRSEIFDLKAVDLYFDTQVGFHG